MNFIKRGDQMFGLSEEKIAKWAEKGKSEQLIKAAKSKKANLRLAAIKGMGQVEDEQVFNYLITCLRDRSSEVKLAALEALKQLNNKNAGEHIKSLIHDSDSKVVDKAREVLRSINVNNEIQG